MLGQAPGFNPRKSERPQERILEAVGGTGVPIGAVVYFFGNKVRVENVRTDGGIVRYLIVRDINGEKREEWIPGDDFEEGIASPSGN